MLSRKCTLDRSMGFRDACLRFYEATRRIIAPDLKYSQWAYEAVLWERSAGKERWLDLGCGRCLLPSWRQDEEPRLVRRARLMVGLDYDHESLVDNTTISCLVRGDASSLPFAGETFDLITSNMVFEHLDDPVRQLRNIRAVLRPGGELVFHTPNAHGYGPVLSRLIPKAIRNRVIWFLQRRKEEDIFPTFYRINTPDDIGTLAAAAGLEVTSLQMVASTPIFIMVPPLVVLELLLIRLLMTQAGWRYRSNIIVVLRRPT